MKEAFELSMAIGTMADHIIEDIGKHNPGCCTKEKTDIASIHFDVALLRVKTGLLHSVISNQLLSDKRTTLKEGEKND